MAAGQVLLEILRARDGEAHAPLPRTMLVGAHPDDETVLAGARLRRLAQAVFVCVTDGAPRNGYDAGRHGLTPQQYAQARRRELESVLGRCGVPPARILSLDCPDQETALLLAPAARKLAQLFAQHGTQAVVTHPYEGGHPDHDAAAFAVRQAFAGEIVEFAAYHLDGKRVWGRFWPDPEAPEHVRPLSAHERALVARAIDAHETQRDVTGGFRPATERWRPAPRYDFAAPPPTGEALYDGFGWALTSAKWRELAARC